MRYDAEALAYYRACLGVTESHVLVERLVGPRPPLLPSTRVAGWLGAQPAKPVQPRVTPIASSSIAGYFCDPVPLSLTVFWVTGLPFF